LGLLLLCGAGAVRAITVGEAAKIPHVKAERKGKAIEAQAFGWPDENYVIIVSPKGSFYIEETRVYELDGAELEPLKKTVHRVTARRRMKAPSPAKVTHDDGITRVEFVAADGKTSWKVELRSEKGDRRYLVPLLLEP
jgi:hypothetical protein